MLSSMNNCTLVIARFMHYEMFPMQLSCAPPVTALKSWSYRPLMFVAARDGRWAATIGRLSNNLRVYRSRSSASVYGKLTAPGTLLPNQYHREGRTLNSAGNTWVCHMLVAPIHLRGNRCETLYNLGNSFHNSPPETP